MNGGFICWLIMVDNDHETRIWFFLLRLAGVDFWDAEGPDKEPNRLVVG